jgi:hypothetical protein
MEIVFHKQPNRLIIHLNFLHLSIIFNQKLYCMPIRMTDDPNQPQDNNDDSGGGRRPNLPGGGGGLMQLLPMLLGLFKGKGIIVYLH